MRVSISFLCTLSLLPQALVALPTGTDAPTYGEVERFWHDQLNITVFPSSLDACVQTLDGYTCACTALEAAFSSLSIQRNEPQYEARRSFNWWGSQLPSNVP